MLLKLADTVLILINKGPSNVNYKSPIITLYISACHVNRLIDVESPFTNTANGWTIDCDMGVWETVSEENKIVRGRCRNWYGFMNENPIGSISTTFNGRGRARLDFGNCWTSGTVYAYLNGNAIASAPANTPSKTVEFDFNQGK